MGIDKHEKKRVHGILSASYQKNNEAEKTLSKQGYKLDKQLSGNRSKVFVDSNGKAHVVHRGTQNLGDVWTDAMITAGLGKYTKRVKHSKKVYKQAQDKYKQKDVNTYGHSLGGYLAENSGNKTGKVTTFNKAASLSGKRVKNKNQHDIRTHNDVVSMFTKKHKGQTQLRGNRNILKSHSVDSLK